MIELRRIWNAPPEHSERVAMLARVSVMLAERAATSPLTGNVCLFGSMLRRP